MKSSFDGQQTRKRLPEWLKRPPRSAKETVQLKSILREARLNTVCEEARCPNIAECFSQRTATFMILGDVCTRGCRFCSVTTGKPLMPAVDFEGEAQRVAEAAQKLGLKYVVVTSVARDDLADGGASGFVATIQALRDRLPQAQVEVLIPDLRGNKVAIKAIVDAAPDVLNHNLETVPRLYRKVRPGASFAGSLELLRYAKHLRPTLLTKTGLMLGLGEEFEEVCEVFDAAREHDVDIFTGGQYMQPSREHLPVHAYITPREFELYKIAAEQRSFRHVFIAPLVRSSYHAGEQTALSAQINSQSV